LKCILKLLDCFKSFRKLLGLLQEHLQDFWTVSHDIEGSGLLERHLEILKRF